MPFPTISGVPENTPKEVLRNLRAGIIHIVATSMGTARKTVRPFFPKDLAGDPDEDQDDTIYVRLDTGMFHNKPDTLEAREEVTSALARLVFDAFGGQYAVEAFIGDLDSESKTHIHVKIARASIPSA